MKITKFGHCCMLIIEQNVRILTDPGMYSTQQNELKNIDVILITHDHSDHLDIDSLKTLLQNNPGVKVITNSHVAEILEKEGIHSEIIEHGKKFHEKGVCIEGYGKDHAMMHSSIPQHRNTGVFIADTLFYPGDSLTNPNREIKVLALPMAGPWLKLSEAIDYALELKSNICFPVHDGILKNSGILNTIPPQILEPQGIKFQVLEIDKEYEF